MSAYKLRALRIPTTRRIETPWVEVAAVPPMLAQIEYLVVEFWSDHTVRHPTTGNVVTLELWGEERARALHFLRTGE